ncbi:MAG: LysR family transcriptional regulator [Gemmatimonadaceae bacterium]|nr:LysR family transcriptional regulator [Gemmatimonadaceae bacterium]NUQ93200.1 LysR family transcriptional regulator [Gemmatimonadaceae bacterium]NUR18976.1 LysR family transcriptional regulator [Gemmatimonadaceae bacterium]
MSDDLNAMAVFAAVAEARGFRAAGDRLGVSASAVSQSLRKLEEGLGVILVRRTTRSVHLTEAGERLYASVRPALEEVRAAVAAIGELGDEPRGTLRLVVSGGAEGFLRETVIGAFLAAHPHIRLDLAVTNEITDIVGRGYDAGIQLGEIIDRDMIAVPVSGDLRLVVVGSPSYFATHRKPKQPRELVEHECINWHPTPDARAYRWEFTEKGREISVAVPTRVLTTDPVLIARLARGGVGLAMLYEHQAREDIERGELVEVLREFSTPFPGFYLYYPKRRHASPALRAFIGHLRGARDGARAPRGRRRQPPGRSTR